MQAVMGSLDPGRSSVKTQEAVESTSSFCHVFCGVCEVSASSCLLFAVWELTLLYYKLGFIPKGGGGGRDFNHIRFVWVRT